MDTMISSAINRAHRSDQVLIGLREKELSMLINDQQVTVGGTKRGASRVEQVKDEAKSKELEIKRQNICKTAVSREGRTLVPF